MNKIHFVLKMASNKTHDSAVYLNNFKIAAPHVFLSNWGNAFHIVYKTATLDYTRMPST